jgi:hypothetical protein
MSKLLTAPPLFLTPNNNILLMLHSDLLKKSIQAELGTERRLCPYPAAKNIP